MAEKSAMPTAPPSGPPGGYPELPPSYDESVGGAGKVSFYTKYLMADAIYPKNSFLTKFTILKAHF